MFGWHDLRRAAVVSFKIRRLLKGEVKYHG
jgi:hypothetical protein